MLLLHIDYNIVDSMLPKLPCNLAEAEQQLLVDSFAVVVLAAHTADRIVPMLEAAVHKSVVEAGHTVAEEAAGHMHCTLGSPKAAVVVADSAFQAVGFVKLD